jgi:hypothetical protein
MMVLLDRLLAVPELRPLTGDWIQSEFDKALDSLSAGPTLTLNDEGMLAWLTTTAEMIDPDDCNIDFDAIYEGAVVCRGELGQVEGFVRETLHKRCQSKTGGPIPPSTPTLVLS